MRPVPYRLGHPGRGGPARAQHQHIHSPYPLLAQRRQQSHRAGALHHQHQRPTLSPHPRPRGDLAAASRWRRRRHQAPRHRRDHDHHERGQRCPAPPGTPAACQHHRNDHQRGRIPSANLAQVKAGGGGGHPRDPGQRGLGRDVDQRRGAAAHQPRREAAHQAPHHHRAGDRHGQEVGRDGGQGDAPEDRHQNRSHAGLGGKRHRQGRRQPALEHRPQPSDAGAGRRGEQEAHRAGEQRVDQHQTPDCNSQQPDTAGGPAGGGGCHCHRSHGHGPQHRRLPPGQHAEHQHHPHPRHQPAPKPHPAQHRPAHGQDECHVLARDGQEVAEPGGAEVVHLEVRLLAVVAKDEPCEQGPAAGVERRSSTHQRAPQLVGEPAQRASRVGSRKLVDAEAAADVPAGQNCPRPSPQRPKAAPDRHPLPRQSLRQNHPVGAPGERLHPPAPEPQLRTHAPWHRFGIGDQRGPARHHAGLGRAADPVPGAGPERRGQGHAGQADDQRPPQARRHQRDPGQRNEQRDGPGQPGAEQDGRRQRRCLPLRHRDTRTLARSAASFDSPIPRTSTSSSTDRNRPCCWR